MGFPYHIISPMLAGCVFAGWICVQAACVWPIEKNIGTEHFRRREFIYSQGRAKIIEPQTKETSAQFCQITIKRH